MNRILVTGSNGQLGSEIKYLSQNDKQDIFFFTDKGELDICDEDLVDSFVIQNEITAIINCAAYTAVDAAEDNPEMCDNINHKAVAILGSIAKKYNCKLIHISTDYVFDGNSYKPYIEEDQVNPISVYGKTKLAGEQSLKSLSLDNSVIIRTSWVYSSFGNNFVKTMRKLSESRTELNVIFDQIGTPTYARDLAQTILYILPNISNKETEIYHYSNEGVCSWYDFAKAIFEISDINIKLGSIEGRDYPTKASRPFYSVKNKNKLKKEFNREIPFWRDSLKKCLEII
jgi:dTDP-4-dehydrorhamnose reductase